VGKLDGKVAFITGAARGQGRSHALRLASEGADIIAVDICADVPSVPYALATPDDLEETASAVRGLGRKISPHVVDVRDAEALEKAFSAGVEELGPVDLVVANAAVCPLSLHVDPRTWQDTVDINLTGVMNTVEVAHPSMTERGAGGSIVLISSTSGLTGNAGMTRAALGYTASKHGVVGLMRAYANGLAPYSIRVNSVHPTGVRTPMVVNDAVGEWLSQPSSAGSSANALPVGMLEPEDVTAAVAWLVSDDARYVTGITLSVDAGYVNHR